MYLQLNSPIETTPLGDQSAIKT